MQYDTNHLTNATFNTETSHISHTDPLKTLHQSDTSLEISQELAFIKNEVINIKNHVFTKVSDDLSPSENCSIQTSLMDPLQTDYLNTEDVTLASNRQDRHDNTPQNISGTQEYQPNDFSSLPSEFASRNRPSMNPFESKSNNIYLSREILSNGLIRDVAAAAEGKTYTVTTTPNDISMANLSKKISTKTPKSSQNEILNRKVKDLAYLASRSNSIDPLLSNGLSTPTTQPSVSVPNLTMLLQSEFSSRKSDSDLSFNGSKYRELISVEEDSEDLRRLDEDGLDDNGEPIFANHYIKKTLSVIFSTNESCPSTPARSLAQPGNSGVPSEISTPLQSGRSQRSRSARRSCQNSARKEYVEEIDEEKETSRSLITPSTNEAEDNKEIQVLEQGLVSEEDFMGMLYMMKVHSKGEKSLVDKLERLKDLHLTQVARYEKGIRNLNEKSEKLNKGNELLVKTLRTCEKEIDSLASNNKILHQNILMFEEDMSKKVNKEKQMIESLMQKQKENDRLKDELQRKEAEIQELKRNLAASNSKSENVKSYAKSCEDSIYAIDQTLRRIIPERGGPQVPVSLVYKVIERILTETSKFVEKLDTVSSGSTATLETETYSKSPHVRDNGRLLSSFGTEESATSTYDHREKSTTRGRSGNKPKESPIKSSSKSSISSSPQPKTTTPTKKTTKSSKSTIKPSILSTAAAAVSSSVNKVENHVLLQRLLNVYSDKQRSLSSNSKKSNQDHNRTSSDTETAKGERKSRSKVNVSASATTPKKSATPQYERTPEKSKSVPKKKKTIDQEEEKMKENLLRRKVMKSLSPINYKK